VHDAEDPGAKRRRSPGPITALSQSLFGAYRSKGVLVLLYHRVAEPPRDPWSLCVSRAQFAQQLRVLREWMHPIPLSALGAHLETRVFRRPRVAIAFDDGYADNLYEAAPLLRACGIPATMFVVSGAVRAGREFWWDELERIVFEPSSSRRSRQVEVQGRTVTWTIPENRMVVCDPWQAWGDDTPTPAHGVYRELYGVLSVLPPEKRTTLLDDFIEQTGLDSAARATHRPLSCDELRELAGSPLIEIGVHTVSHPVLSRLPVARQAQEVLEATTDLESMTGLRMHQFSYPYGKRDHYDRNTIEIVRSAGFDFAYVNEPGLAGVSVDRFQVPRVVVPALNGPEFAGWLAHVLPMLA
jgi:peptidoglycan/xylan/chitin deacetylase (PgdA/CDA1 family)